MIDLLSISKQVRCGAWSRKVHSLAADTIPCNIAFRKADGWILPNTVMGSGGFPYFEIPNPFFTSLHILSSILALICGLAVLSGWKTGHAC